MTTIAIPTDETTKESTHELDISLAPSAAARSEPGRRATPFFVPRDQRYYWTGAWQQGEAEALRELAEGKGRRFGSGAAAAEWLLSDEE